MAGEPWQLLSAGYDAFRVQLCTSEKARFVRRASVWLLGESMQVPASGLHVSPDFMLPRTKFQVLVDHHRTTDMLPHLPEFAGSGTLRVSEALDDLHQNLPIDSRCQEIIIVAVGCPFVLPDSRLIQALSARESVQLVVGVALSDAAGR